MVLTPAQNTTLKNFINNDPVLSLQPNNDDGHFAIAQALNQPTTDAFTWKDRGQFTLGEILGNGYDYTRIDNLTVGKARIWDEVKSAIQLGQFTANQTNHRAAISAAFTAAADDNMRLAIFGHLQRFATRFERVFLAGNGSTTNNAGSGPLTLVVSGPISPNDIGTARNS